MRDARHLREHGFWSPRALLPRLARALGLGVAVAASLWGGWQARGILARRLWRTATTDAAPPLQPAPSLRPLRPEGGAVMPATASPARQPVAAPSGSAALQGAPRPALDRMPTTGAWTLEVARVASRAEARALAGQLQRRGHAPTLFAVGGSRAHTAVRMGSFTGLAHAEKARLQLAHSDIVATAVRVPAADVAIDPKPTH